MIELIYSNRTERLLEELVGYLKEQRSEGAHPLDPIELVVPNRNMETWVGLGMAQLAGVAANLRFRRLERFVGELVSEAFNGEMRLVDLDFIEAAILSILLDEAALDQPELWPVRRYLESARVGKAERKTSFDAHLDSDGADLRRVQLASRLAHLFQEYAYARPEMIASWRGKVKSKGVPFADPAVADPSLLPTAAWQRALWRGVFGPGGVLERSPPNGGGRWTTLDLLALDDRLFERLKETGLPTVHVFGVSYVARLFQILFGRLGEVSTLRIYTLNPCAEYWEDVETHREFFQRLDRERDSRSRRVWRPRGEPEEQDDPFGLTLSSDMPALRYWGRPGREHVRLLGELTECDFKSAFADPVGEKSGLLHLLQRDILLREWEPARAKAKEKTHALEETLKLVAAPSVRREVEWVADEIWRLMRENEAAAGPPLRFSDVAVIVNSADRDSYLPQIEAVFAACHDLPSSVSDLPGAAGSRLIEAMGLMLKLPFGRFSRAEMLAMMSHPAVIGRFDDVSPDDLTDRAEALGIVFGADHSDHAGTYIDEDVFNWDQGIRRLALGAFMTGEKSGDQRIFETKGGGCLVEEGSGSSLTAAARFGLLARALIADSRFVRERKMTLSDWARFYSAQIDAYLFVDGSADARDRLRCLRSLSKLEAMDQGHQVSGRVAAELALRAIESLGGGRGQYLAEGVVVSSFLPMRAIPFKVVFVLGLGEGLFPASGRRDALDLRSARRRAGDVDPSERDRYMFLETLLCAREKLYLSYVRRDEQTGDLLQPSAVVQELLHMLKLGYLDEEQLKALRVEPPLRRFDEPGAKGETFLDEARVEARVQALSNDWRARVSHGSGPGAESSALSGSELEELRGIVAPEAWQKLSSMLVLPGEPPDIASVTATARSSGSAEAAAVEAPIHLSLSSLRAFLTCPMQGWARTMLGLPDEEDDLVDREEEDFEIGRPQETGLLREVFLDAAARGIEAEEVYAEQARRLRLKGRLPVGVLGSVLGSRHHQVLEGWRRGLAELERGEEAADEKRVPVQLHRIRLGRSSQESATETVLDPLVLNVPLSRAGEQDRVVPVRISGRTEGLLGDGSVSVTFQPSAPPSGNDRTTKGRLFRYLIRGIVDHAVLSAMGAVGAEERRVVSLMAKAPDEFAHVGLRLRPLDRERARAWLTDVVRDLLGDSHAYLLPCEAVFMEYCERTAPPKKAKKGKAAAEDEAACDSEPPAELSSPGGERLRSTVTELSENEWGRFSSLWGPVPSPREYEPPSAEEAALAVTRRFGPLFDDILEVEDSR